MDSRYSRYMEILAAMDNKSKISTIGQIASKTHLTTNGVSQSLKRVLEPWECVRRLDGEKGQMEWKLLQKGIDILREFKKKSKAKPKKK